MSIKVWVLTIGTLIFLTSCAGSRLGGQVADPAEEGVRHLLGRGVPKDNAKAFYYFSRAADQDDPFAQNEVAYMYAAGKGTPRNYPKALHYYQKAANHDLASAQYSLGQMYLYGLGTSPNKALAMQWFARSASHGFEPAKAALARNR